MLIEMLLFLLFILFVWWLYRRFGNSGQPAPLSAEPKAAEPKAAEPKAAERWRVSNGTAPKNRTDNAVDEEEGETIRKAVSFEPDGNFKLGGKSSNKSVQAYAAKIQRVPSASSASPAVDSTIAEAAPTDQKDGNDEWRLIASTGVVSDEEREFVASLLRQIDENNRDITSLSARARGNDKLREQVSELHARLDEREQALARATGLPDGPEASQLKSQVQTLSQQLLVRDRELTQLKSNLATAQDEARDARRNATEKNRIDEPELLRLRSELQVLRQEQKTTELQLGERNQRVVELEARLQRYVTGDDHDHSDKSSPARTFASGAVADAAARAASRSTDPKPHTARLRQLYQPPEESDDLKQVKGIGLKMEQLLNQLGVTTFRQLASFEQQDIEDVSAELKAFPGRIQRDNWVGQAARLQAQLYGDNVSA